MAIDKVVDSAVLDSTFKGIADAIRAKAGTTEGIAHTALAEAIGNLPDNAGQFVWDRHAYTETKSAGSGLAITIKSVEAGTSFAVGTLDLTFYEGYKYDEATGTFSGWKPVKEYVQPSAFYSGTILSAEAVPDDTYVIVGGRLYRTSASSKYATEYYYPSSGGSLCIAMLYGLQQITALEVGAFDRNVVSDSEDGYPDGGVVNGFYYEKKALGGDGAQYGWEKYEGTIQTAGNTNAYVKSGNMNYLSYAEVGLTLYRTIVPADGRVAFDDLYTISADGSKTYYYVGDIVFTAEQIPAGYYIQVGADVYRTTSSTTYEYVSEEYNGLWYHLKLQNVEQVIVSYSLMQHVFNDAEDTYPDNGIADDGFYYKKVLPLSLETDLIPENIKEGVNILGVFGTMSAGVSGVDYGKVSLSSASSYSVKHKLGVIPTHVILIKTSTPFFNSYYTVLNINNYCVYSSGSSYGYCYTKSISKTAVNITFQAYSSSYPYYGDYLWIAIA